jgi:hypothetical protein
VSPDKRRLLDLLVEKIRVACSKPLATPIFDQEFDSQHAHIQAVADTEVSEWFEEYPEARRALGNVCVEVYSDGSNFGFRITTRPRREPLSAN